MDKDLSELLNENKLNLVITYLDETQVKETWEFDKHGNQFNTLLRPNGKVYYRTENDDDTLRFKQYNPFCKTFEIIKFYPHEAQVFGEIRENNHFNELIAFVRG